jgi:hypothetical protein
MLWWKGEERTLNLLALIITWYAPSSMRKSKAVNSLYRHNGSLHHHDIITFTHVTQGIILGPGLPEASQKKQTMGCQWQPI